MFQGVSTLNLDTKGRMAIPARHRDVLTHDGVARVVVTINPREHCLWLYPENEWEDIAYKLSRLPSLRPQTQLLQRLLLGHAVEAELDAQGRILLSTELREYAALGKKVSLVGQGHKFEIWNEATWAEQRETWLTEADVALSELADGDLSEMVL